MKLPNSVVILTIALISTVVQGAVLSGTVGAEERTASSASVTNAQVDGTYILKTDDPYSIQAYYSDLGMGPLVLLDAEAAAQMRETCLLLGDAWRPLGYVNLQDSNGRNTYPLDLCYYAAPNPDDVARAKCANLGLALLENRQWRREVVCTRWESAAGPREKA